MKVGIDIGGSHIGIGLIDENGNIVKKEEMIIQEKNDITKIIEEFIIEKIMQMALFSEIESIGIAVPGTIKENKIQKAINLGIENYDLALPIEKILKVPVKLRNDAKCSALAEQKYGELANYKNAIFLCIGTGIGGAVIFDGKLLEPERLPGFEFSHMIIQKDGLHCNCGKKGCFETYASLKKFKEKISNEFNLGTLDGKIIRKFMRDNINNEKLKEYLNTYIEDLSIGISNIINIFEPEAIVFGGSFAEYEDLIIEPLKRSLLEGNLLFNKRDDIIIKHAKLKNEAGIIGATLI